MNLADLFPDEDFRFHMALRRGTLKEFFGQSAAKVSLLAERRRWLAGDAHVYSACLPEGVSLLDECADLAHELGALSDEQRAQLAATGDSKKRCAALGAAWEPDFLLLRPDPTCSFRLLAGCVCFPSSWSLEEKIGQPIEAIHGAVPTLNARIGPTIRSFLSKLTPGTAWLRHNWGLSRSPELNQHPQRRLARLDGSVESSDVWLRIEHQALVVLPRSESVLFGIRIVTYSLSEVKEERAAAAKLQRALRTMPYETAAYKGLATAREKIIDLLQ